MYFMLSTYRHIDLDSTLSLNLESNWGGTWATPSSDTPLNLATLIDVFICLFNRILQSFLGPFLKRRRMEIDNDR